MFSWVEIHSCFSFDEHLRVKNALVSENIPIKEKFHSIRGRLGRNTIMRGSPFVINTAGIDPLQQQYIIHKDRAEEARYLLNKIRKS